MRTTGAKSVKNEKMMNIAMERRKMNRLREKAEYRDRGEFDQARTASKPIPAVRGIP